MKSTIATTLLGGLTLALSFTSLASAQTTGAEAKMNAEAKKHSSSTVATSASATSSMKKNDDRGSATSSARREVREEPRDNASTTPKGPINAEAHRSAVATFVKSLLEVADREGGIGAEVRAVAQAQQDSASTTATAITKVESKGKWQTFFFGSDYDSLGELRKELVTTQNNIDMLKKLADKSWYLGDKMELEAQIKTLEDAQAEITTFIDTHEGTFSLFGWAMKLL